MNGTVQDFDLVTLVHLARGDEMAGTLDERSTVIAARATLAYRGLHLDRGACDDQLTDREVAGFLAESADPERVIAGKCADAGYRDDDKDDDLPVLTPPPGRPA